MDKSINANNTTTTTPSAFLGYDHITFWVGNAKQAAEWYCINFGFEEIGYRGLESNPRDDSMVSHVIKQGRIIFVLQSSLKPENKEFGRHQQIHGDGVKDISFTVNDCRKVYEEAVLRGAKSVLEPTVHENELGQVIIATISTFGDITHTFVERKNYRGNFLPGFQEVSKTNVFKDFTPPINLEFIDHAVGNQSVNEVNKIADWYQNVLNFRRFWSIDDKMIKTENSSLKSVVLTDEGDHFKFLVCEPSNGTKKSQIQEFIDFYGGSGIQHIAFHTSDIIHTVKYLRKRGVQFLTVHKDYYNQIRQKLSVSSPKISEDLDLLEQHNILIDYDSEGYLLQIFTKPIQDRPTLFYEIIQRNQFDGFGAGNILALYKSFESEQNLRGNLTENIQK